MKTFEKIKGEIHAAALTAGRDPASIQLVAVTKGVPWADAADLYNAGQRDFGESRVNDALEKIQNAPSDCHWHFIGTLQSNKLNKVIGKFSLIHSIDSLELAQKLSHASLEHNIITHILLQANTSGEKSKHGLSPDDWRRCFAEVKNLKGVTVEGLMTMAPAEANEKEIRECFSRLRELRDELGLRHLSMGMSNDFKLAIAEGATIVRIGRALF